MRALPAICLILSLGLVAPAGAQSTGSSAFRVSDLPGWEHPGTPWQIDVVTAAGGVADFGADDGLHGGELWVTDGSVATLRSIDLCPGPCLRAGYVTNI
jgi:ELWxxDGT repeat protein